MRKARLQASSAKYALIVVAVAAAAVALPSVAQSHGSRVAHALTGTSWQLVSIKTMTDEPSMPDDGSKYTVTFGADRRAAIRADCNRGVATWHSPEEGDLEFGPLKMTRVKCADGSMHGRFTNDLAYVRSYLFENGHLYLSLVADGGILEFSPLEK